MEYTIDKIATQIGAKIERCKQNTEGDNYTSRTAHYTLLTDSRSLSFPQDTIFFAITTQKGDGHRYVQQLYQRGVRLFVVTHAVESCPEATFFIVPDVMLALQRLAERHREEFTCPVVGITGSNGKTVVKEWLYQLLAPDFSLTRSPRSYNSQTGVPLSVWQMNENTEVALIEAGISEMGEMERLQAVVQPTIGVFTCLGPAHQDGFGSLQVKCEEKMRLFRDSDYLVCPYDDLVVRRALAASQFHGKALTWSMKDKSAWLYINKVSRNADTTTFEAVIRKSTQGDHLIALEHHTFTIPFIDEASLSNAITCVAVCLHLELKPDVIAERMTRLEPVAMRLEVKEGVRGLTLINDSYNCDIASLEIALDFMARRPEPKGRSLTLILSDIPGADAETYRRAMQLAETRGVKRVIRIGRKDAQYPTTEAFMASREMATMHDQVVLLKGARVFGFDRITARLEQRVHQTILEVDLGALVQNLAHYRSLLKPDTKMMCMVKANAYGAGAVEVSRCLQDHGVDYLAVAVADEGAELRRAGITCGIIVMNPELAALDTLFQYNLEPEIYSFDLLQHLVRYARQQGITQWPVHIKLDTGMHRLGFDPVTDMESLTDALTRQLALVPRSVFSHFVGSDAQDFDQFSQRQFELFTRGADALQRAFPQHHILRHMCNTAGIEHFPERQMDMVRLGLGLYGINPLEGGSKLMPISTLKTTILQIHDVPAGETVGYSRRGRVMRPSRIAALPIGYADGLNRHLGNGHCHCIVKGRPAPYVGNICMDVCMIDVTGIPCREGDEAIIFGTEQMPVTSLSDTIDTIPYEVLTSVSARVPRVYFRE